MLHPCEVIYQYTDKPREGEVEGICRFTGKQSKGLPFDKWIRDTFTDHGYLKPGTIVSNEALFSFQEASTFIQRKTGRDKAQRFRTYSHIVANGEWHCFTKANKKEIAALLPDAELVCLSDSGQKHLLFKHMPGFWQLEETFCLPDVDGFNRLTGLMRELMGMGFGQTEIQSGQYNAMRILKAGMEVWDSLEMQLEPERGTPLFELAAWLLYKDDK